MRHSGGAGRFNRNRVAEPLHGRPLSHDSDAHRLHGDADIRLASLRHQRCGLLYRSGLHFVHHTDNDLVDDRFDRQVEHRRDRPQPPFPTAGRASITRHASSPCPRATLTRSYTTSRCLGRDRHLRSDRRREKLSRTSTAVPWSSPAYSTRYAL